MLKLHWSYTFHSRKANQQNTNHLQGPAILSITMLIPLAMVWGSHSSDDNGSIFYDTMQCWVYTATNVFICWIQLHWTSSCKTLVLLYLSIWHCIWKDRSLTMNTVPFIHIIYTFLHAPFQYSLLKKEASHSILHSFFWQNKCILTIPEFPWTSEHQISICSRYTNVKHCIG